MKEGISKGLKPASLAQRNAKAKALAYLETKTKRPEGMKRALTERLTRNRRIAPEQIPIFRTIQLRFEEALWVSQEGSMDS